MDSFYCFKQLVSLDLGVWYAPPDSSKDNVLSSLSTLVRVPEMVIEINRVVKKYFFKNKN